METTIVWLLFGSFLVLLLIGTALASEIGTTGAAMVMIRPLLAISREIDTLRGTSDKREGKLMPEVRMPVVELENVRRSFNNYQNRLAELQLRVLWEEILRRCPIIEVVGEPERVSSCMFHGFSRLPVRVPA